MIVHDNSMEVAAPAKINLTLEVLNRRDDGFHDLRTLMLRLRLHDTIHFSRRDDDTIELEVRYGGVLRNVAHPQLANVKDNLVVRAANALRDFVGRRPGATIQLWKRIPLQAGLGGGSSDAASTLLALNQLWGLHLPGADIAEIAASLGSDLNFFLNRATAAICEGRGERVKPVACRSGIPVVLARPNTGLSTAAVFGELHDTEIEDTQSTIVAAELLRRDRWAHQRHNATNALQSAALRQSPAVEFTLSALEKAAGIRPTMSGSGTTCFVVCRTFRHAQVVARRMQQQRFEGIVLPTLGW